MTGEPDLRWHGHVADHGALVARIEAWTVSDAVPESIADVLRVARALLIDSYFIYEYSLVAATWALLATEACLKDCVPRNSDKGPDKRTFGPLIREALRRGLIRQDEADALRGAAELRNRIVHGYLRPKDPGESYTPQDAMVMLESIHEAVSDLYARALIAP